MYRIAYLKQALKDFNKIPANELFKIKESIESLKKNPKPTGSKKLKGIKNLYRLRKGVYRIIYKIEEKEIIIIIVSVRHRKDVYRGL